MSSGFRGRRSIPFVFSALTLFALPAFGQETWRRLAVTEENRCSSYSSSQYSYSQSLEDDIVDAYGGVYSPYTGEWFDSDRKTDIEHIVARSEAHDSGLCSASADRKREFASDLLNLTLADPSTNRDIKSARDAAEWLPELNRCWFANRVVRVKQKYGLTVDVDERNALRDILSNCGSVNLIVYPSHAGPLSGIYTGSGQQALVITQNRAGDTANITLFFEVGPNDEIVPTTWSAEFARTEEAPVGFTRYFPSGQPTELAEEPAQ